MDDEALVLTSLQAADGDCFVLSYGSPRHHVVVDCGRMQTYPRLREFLDGAAARGEVFELLVVTHVDADHIEGAVELAGDRDLPLAPRAVWFNGFDQLVPTQEMGFAQADEFSAAVRRRGWALNPQFGGMAIMRAAPDAPTTVELRGGMRLHVVSPDGERLGRLRDAWLAHRTPPKPDQAALPPGVQVMGRDRRPPVPLDFPRLLAEPERVAVNVPNAASIALIAEWRGRRCFLMSDAHPTVLVQGLRSLCEGMPVRCDLTTVVHHGSFKNMTSQLAAAIDCGRYLVSTDGTHHGHPDPPAIARLLARGAGRRTLFFNHRQPWTSVWDDPGLKDELRYETVYPAPDEMLLRVRV